jgi:chloramphenicol 3-O phosphotransferase
MALDAFLGMFPARQGKSVSSERSALQVSDEARKAIYMGPAARRLISGYHYSIAACASVGNNLIVDHVLWDLQWRQECITLLSGFSVFFVGVRCPLNVLEARERERGDRTLGQARAQFAYVHLDALYDLEIDTSLASPQECAAYIIAALRRPPTPSAFQQLRTLSRDQ